MYEEYQQRLREILSDKRFAHSIGVMETAKALAEQYGEDQERAALAGLLHDVAKELSLEESLEKCKAYGVALDEYMLRAPKTIHAPLGAEVLRNEWGISDEEILHAVAVHTLGDTEMSLLDKIIYMADYVEPNRTFGGVEELRELAFRSLDEAIMVGASWTLTEIIEGGRTIHPISLKVYNEYAIKLEEQRKCGE